MGDKKAINVPLPKNDATSKTVAPPTVLLATLLWFQTEKLLWTHNFLLKILHSFHQWMHSCQKEISKKIITFWSVCCVHYGGNSYLRPRMLPFLLCFKYNATFYWHIMVIVLFCERAKIGWTKTFTREMKLLLTLCAAKKNHLINPKKVSSGNK